MYIHSELGFMIMYLKYFPIQLYELKTFLRTYDQGHRTHFKFVLIN